MYEICKLRRAMQLNLLALIVLGGVMPSKSVFASTLYALDNDSDVIRTVSPLGSVGLHPGSLPAQNYAGLTIDFSGRIPEPSTFTLAGLGLVALGLFGWRRRKRALRWTPTVGQFWALNKM